MNRVSRPLIGLLVATVAVFAMWVTMLKPSSPTGGTGSGNIATNPSLGQLNGAVAAAHAAVASANAASLRHGGAIVTAPSHPQSAPAGHPVAPATTPATTPAGPVPHPTVRAHRAAGHHRLAPRGAPQPIVRLTPARRLAIVRRALVAHKVLALLFFNSASADDRAVARELAAVPTHRGAVVKLAIPLIDVAGYASLVAQEPISVSPTLLLVDRIRGATELIGFADRFEIAQRVTDALAVR